MINTFFVWKTIFPRFTNPSNSPLNKPISCLEQCINNLEKSNIQEEDEIEKLYKECFKKCSVYS